MPVTFLYCFSVPRDILGLPFDHDNPVHMVIYSHHVSERAPSSPSFCVMLVI